MGRGDELVSENLRLRTEAASLEEAEERVARGECWDASTNCFGAIFLAGLRNLSL